MQIYEFKKGGLNQVERDPFKLEKDIQGLVEGNLDTLFGLEFVSSEFAIGEFRLDSLAFDAENSAFVIDVNGCLR